MAKAKGIRFRSILIAFGTLTLVALWIWHLRALPDAEDNAASSSGRSGSQEENLESLSMLLKDSRSAMAHPSKVEEDKESASTHSASQDWKTGGNGSVRDLCVNLAKEYEVVPDKTWGKMDKNENLQRTWRNYRCDLELKGGAPNKPVTTASKEERKGSISYDGIVMKNAEESVEDLVKQVKRAPERPTAERLGLSGLDAEKARFKEAGSWCNAIKKLYKVKPGASWGGLQKRRRFARNGIARNVMWS